jgi:hypothetical protein
LYTEADEIGKNFDKTHYDFISKRSNYKNLMIDFTPVSYNSFENKATLYKEVDIKYTYKTNQKAILLSSNPDSRYYVLGGKINNKIKVIKRRGFGFRNVVNFAKRIFIDINYKPILLPATT